MNPSKLLARKRKRAAISLCSETFARDTPQSQVRLPYSVLVQQPRRPSLFADHPLARRYAWALLTVPLGFFRATLTALQEPNQNHGPSLAELCDTTELVLIISFHLFV